MHAPGEALAATPEGGTRVESLEIEAPAHQTGAGDHFAGGLGYALGRGWDWGLALACAHACAARYVATGAAGTADELERFVQRRADEVR